MRMADLPFPLSGATLLTGPSNAGKTRLTATSLDAWVSERGSEGITVLDFAPELERDDVILGGRLTRFTEVPDDAWCGVLEAHAPRAMGETSADAADLAAENACRARRILERAPPEPRAIFVNDATIPFQGDDADTGALTTYCEGAEVAVLNAFDSTELGVDDSVSRNERAALDALNGWADRVVEL